MFGISVCCVVYMCACVVCVSVCSMWYLTGGHSWSLGGAPLCLAVGCRLSCSWLCSCLACWLWQIASCHFCPCAQRGVILPSVVKYGGTDPGDPQGDGHPWWLLCLSPNLHMVLSWGIWRLDGPPQHLQARDFRESPDTAA